MRKLMLAALGLASLVPTLAQAQDAEPGRDRRDVRRQEQQFRQTERHGDVRRGAYDGRDARPEYRQDWQGYRRDHREAFRRPAYVAPHGRRYVPVAVGHRFAPVYYTQRYRLNDWQRFRLPPPRPSAGYIRYGNDVALVDLRTGLVLQLFNAFFY